MRFVLRYNGYYMTFLHCKCVLHINHFCVVFSKVKFKFTSKDEKFDLSALKEFLSGFQSLASKKKILTIKISLKFWKISVMDVLVWNPISYHFLLYYWCLSFVLTGAYILIWFGVFCESFVFGDCCSRALSKVAVNDEHAQTMAKIYSRITARVNDM